MKKILCVVATFLMLSGCAVNDCARSRMALDSARAVYDAALISGQADKIERYRWAVDAAFAVHQIVCAEVQE